LLENEKEKAEDGKGLDPDLDQFYGHLPIVSKQNELAAWKLIEKFADIYMAKYPTSIEDDKWQLELDDKEKKLSINVRNCVMYRLSEKNVL